jgi:hypothetical protein
MLYKNRIIHAHNKTKTTWKIINEDMGINSGRMKERGKKKNNEIQSLKVHAESFNEQFINIAKNITDKLKRENVTRNRLTSYSPYNLSEIYKLKFNNTIFRNTSSGEIESIIKKLPIGFINVLLPPYATTFTFFILAFTTCFGLYRGHLQVCFLKY